MTFLAFDELEVFATLDHADKASPVAYITDNFPLGFFVKHLASPVLPHFGIYS